MISNWTELSTYYESLAVDHVDIGAFESGRLLEFERKVNEFNSPELNVVMWLQHPQVNIVDNSGTNQLKFTSFLHVLKVTADNQEDIDSVSNDTMAILLEVIKKSNIDAKDNRTQSIFRIKDLGTMSFTSNNFGNGNYNGWRIQLTHYEAIDLKTLDTSKWQSL